MDYFISEYIFNKITTYWLQLSLLITAILLYRYLTSTFNHFLDKGVPYKKPVVVLGNTAPVFLMKKSYYEHYVDLYKSFKGFRIAGVFEGPVPVMMIRDPELLKTIMIRDFDHFTDRQDVKLNSESELMKMLILLKGKEWRSVRLCLTPVFSSVKLRCMDPMIQHCCKQMIEFLKQRPVGETEMEMKLFTCRYTLDAIGSCAFGIDCGSLKHPEAEFVKMAEKFMDIPFYERAFFLVVKFVCPPLVKYIPVTMFNMETIRYLCDVVQKTKVDRLNNPSHRREDFIQMLLDASMKEDANPTGEKVLTNEIIVGQALVFFIAGFETSSSTLTLACSILAHMPELQERLRRDIMIAIESKKTDSYFDLVNEIPLLEQVLLETLRMYPIVHRIERSCTKEYTIPGTHVKVNVGDLLVIPAAGIMSDPQYYPNPEVFDPDRFSPEEKKKRDLESYLAFGMGPRFCIGKRFAMLTAKCYLTYLLQHYKLKPSSKTKMPLKFDRKSLLIKPDRGLWINIEPLEHQ